MTYATIEDGESTPLQGGHSVEAISGHTSTNKRAVAAIVCAVMVGATISALVLMMAGPLTMPLNGSSNVDTMVVVSSTATQEKGSDITKCAPATGKFSGLSCKDSDGNCAGPGSSFGEHPGNDFFETCYVSNNSPPNDRCWSCSHTVSLCALWVFCDDYHERCDPVGYLDGDIDYNKDGVWHVSAPLSDGSCGNPCQEFKPTYF